MTSRLFHRPIALGLAFLVLWFAACSSAKVKEQPTRSEEPGFKVSVSAEPVTPAAPPVTPLPVTPPSATPPSVTAPSVAPPSVAPPSVTAPSMTVAPKPEVVAAAPSEPPKSAAPETPAPKGPARPKAERKERARAQAAEPDEKKPQATEEHPPIRIRQATSETRAPVPVQAPGRLVVFNFDNADIEIVLQATSELLVFNYVLAPTAKGKKVTVQTTGKIPVDDVFPVLLTILDVNGLAAVRSGNLYRIIPKEGAVQTSTKTVVGTELDSSVPGDQVVTMIIPLKFASAADVMNLLRPFVPQQGAATTHRDTNLLVLTDAAANIRRLLDIVKLVDVDVALNELQIIPLKHADAQEVAQILTQLFASGRFRPSGTQPPAGITPTPAPTPAQPRPPTPVQPCAGTDAGQERAPLIVPERRSNSLIIYARKQEMDTISRLIEKLDTDIYGGQRVFIYFAENTKSRELAATLDAIFGRGGQAPPPPGTAGPTVPTTGQRGQTGLVSPPTTQPTTARIGPYTAAGGGGLLGPGGLIEEGAPRGAETRFIPDEPTNSIIVTTYPRVWAEIEEIIKKLDRMPRQVLIEVLAVEVTLTDELSLGLQWAVREGRFDFNFSDRGGVPSRPDRSMFLPPFGGSTLAGLNFFTFAADKFVAAINLLAALNRANVLSTPSIMTTENKKAVINVSRSVPILTSQQLPIGGTTVTGQTQPIVGTQTVEYRDAGIVLTVTPRIGEQGTVALDIKQEVNDVGAPVPPTNSPEFQKREAETSVVLLNNQTLVLGGLIQNKRTLTKSGIPFLNRIPVLGYLFGGTDSKIEKTELLLVITPRVVGTAVDAARITDEVRKARPDLMDLMREFPYVYPVPPPPPPTFPLAPPAAPKQ